MPIPILSSIQRRRSRALGEDSRRGRPSDRCRSRHGDFHSSLCFRAGAIADHTVKGKRKHKSRWGIRCPASS
jgi:hypothetical protein